MVIYRNGILLQFLVNNIDVESPISVLVAEAPPGVYIYLGYSKKDSLILQRGRVKLGKKVCFIERNFTSTLLTHDLRCLIRKRKKGMK